jgi:hypothetical protein
VTVLKKEQDRDHLHILFNAQARQGCCASIYRGENRVPLIPKVQSRAWSQGHFIITSTFDESIVDSKMIATILSLPEDGHFV